MTLVEKALRRWLGAPLPTVALPIVAALSDDVIFDLARRFEAEPETLASGLAEWGMVAAKYKQPAKPLQVRDELLALIETCKAGLAQADEVERSTWPLSPAAIEEIARWPRMWPELKIEDWHKIE